MTLIAYLSDLMFRSRVDGVARPAGARVVYLGRGIEPAAAVDQHHPDWALVDLGFLAGEAERMIAALHARGVRVLAFGPHVDGARLEAARAAGADLVVPRSAALRELGQLLAPGARE